MKKIIICALLAVLIFVLISCAEDQKNDKTRIKEIKVDTDKWKDIPCLWFWKN